MSRHRTSGVALLDVLASAVVLATIEAQVDSDQTFHAKPKKR